VQPSGGLVRAQPKVRLDAWRSDAHVDAPFTGLAVPASCAFCSDDGQAWAVAQHVTKVLRGHVGATEELPDAEVDQRDRRTGVLDQVVKVRGRVEKVGDTLDAGEEDPHRGSPSCRW